MIKGGERGERARQQDDAVANGDAVKFKKKKKKKLSLIHKSEPTRLPVRSRMPSYA